MTPLVSSNKGCGVFEGGFTVDSQDKFLNPELKS